MEFKILRKTDDLNGLLTQIDKLLYHLKRRIGKVVLSEKSPIPVAVYYKSPPLDGVVLNYISPVDVTIIRVAMAVDFVEEDEPPTFIAKSVGPSKTEEVPFYLDKSPIVVSTQIKLNAGDKFSLMATHPDKLTGVWFSMLLELPKHELTRNSYLLHQYEALLEQREKEEE